MTVFRNIEINGIPTNVIVYYWNNFGHLFIEDMTDEDGNTITPDLLSEIDTQALIDSL